MDEATGQLYLTKEIDLESLDFDRFVLEIQATQKDNPLKTAMAKVNTLTLKSRANSSISLDL